jgi:hypothetical protein
MTSKWVGFRRACIAFLLLIGSAFADESLPTVSVEAQPLASNTRRVAEALATLGRPLPATLLSKLEESSDDAATVQSLIDPHILAAVTIQPNMPLEVARGPASVVLQQAGYTPMLVKIINERSATNRLKIVSPESGPVYAGVAPLSMQRQQQMALAENPNKVGDKTRFLDAEMLTSPPMTERLSGLKVEYAIALLYSHEAGKRDATIGFQLGDGAEPSASSNQAKIQFDMKPAVRVVLNLADENGRETVARLLFQDSQEHVYPPQAKRIAPDLFFQPHIYRASGEYVLLPPGKFRVQYSRGPEYRVVSRDIEIPTAAEHRLDLKLERWIDAAKFGFYSGDHHIHAAGCAHYTSPTEGVAPEDMFRQVKGEGLNVGSVLTWGPCFRYQRQFFQPKPSDISETLTLLKYDLEISGFGSQALGHVCLLNLSDQTYPGSDGLETKGWPTWTIPVLRWCKEQGGVTGYAHSASGMWIEEKSAATRLLKRIDSSGDGELSPEEARGALLPLPFEAIDADISGRLSLNELIAAHARAAEQLPNYAIPEMNGVGAMECPVAVVEGVCDFISSMDTRRIQEWNTWYHILNCGFPLKTSGETDFPCMSSRNVGQGRVYVRMNRASDQALDYAAWCEGIRAGRSYVSDGYAHAVGFSVNDVRPGESDVRLAAPGSVEVVAQVAFAHETPLAVAHGSITPPEGRRMLGDTVELHGPRYETMVSGGKRLVEIVVNGETVVSREVNADGTIHDLRFDVPIERSSWVALRHFPQLHTNPVNVIVADQPIRASRKSAQWCLDVIDLLWKNRQARIATGERPAARAVYDRAIATYGRILEECGR